MVTLPLLVTVAAGMYAPGQLTRFLAHVRRSLDSTRCRAGHGVQRNSMIW
jgi:hypothetical protein